MFKGRLECEMVESATAARGDPSRHFPKLKKGHYGSSRSLVRAIASVLPIPPKYEIKPLSQDKLARSLGEEFAEQSKEDGGFYLGAGLQSLWDEVAVRMGTWKAGKEQEEEEDEVMEGGAAPVHQDQAVVRKIASLEAELSKLRTQIASYALRQEDTLEPHHQAPPVAPPPPPSLPPPPPPPPPMMPQTPRVDSTKENTDGTARQLAVPQTPKPNPSLLAEISSVQLRAIARSPGGTPLRPRHRDPRTPDNDPAAIIARALQKKFSHLVFQDTPDSSRQEDDFSPVTSPL